MILSKWHTAAIVTLATVLLLALPVFAQQLTPKYDPRVPEFSVMELISPAGPKVPYDDECCSEPGEIASCWWDDAKEDYVTCTSGAITEVSNCSTGSCDVTNISPKSTTDTQIGLCTCSNDDDCNAQCADYISGDNTTRCGICDTDSGICGPSFCNGYKACSCFAGCADVYHRKNDVDTDVYFTPYEMCGDTDNGYDGNCCEGNYPTNTGGQEVGYCSDDSDCSNELTCRYGQVQENQDAFGNPIADDCIIMVCDNFATYHEQPLQSVFPPDDTETDTDILKCCSPSISSTYNDLNTCTLDDCDAVTFEDLYLPFADGDPCGVSVDALLTNICQLGVCRDTDTSDSDIDCVPDYSDGDTSTCQAFDICVGVPVCQDPDTTDTDTVLLDCVVIPSGIVTDTEMENCQDNYDANGFNPVNRTQQVTAINYACADNDYDVSSLGRFGACGGSLAGADYVYNYSVASTYTDTDAASPSFSRQPYQLEHLAVQAQKTDSNWEPLLHTREATTVSDTDFIDYCDDANNLYTCAPPCTMDSPNTYSGAYSTCNGSNPAPFLTTGPWPVRVYPDNRSFVWPGTPAQWYTEDDWYGSIFLDTWFYSPLTHTDGGPVNLSTIKEDHNNNYCTNTENYIAAPVVRSFTSWKQLWQGNNVGYDNSQTPGIISNCTSYGAGGNAKPAYFRVDFDEGVDPDGWAQNYKIYVDPGELQGNSEYYDVITHWWKWPNEISCSGIKTGPGAATDCGSNPEGLAVGVGYGNQETTFIYDDLAKGREGWLEVTNNTSGDEGVYNLNVLRVPREFLGMKDHFSGPSSACSGANFGEEDWDLVVPSDPSNNNGTQVDFIPSNDPIEGYLVNVHPPDPALMTNGWLVDPDNPNAVLYCAGGSCMAPDASATIVKNLPFYFPFSGELHTSYRVDPNGRIDFGDATMTSAISMVASSARTNNERPPGFNPSVSPMWGTLTPCTCANTSGGFFSDKRWDGGKCFLDKYQYDNRFVNIENGSCTTDADCAFTERCTEDSRGDFYCIPDYRGKIFTQNTVWNGTTVTVITWYGFDGYMEPDNPNDNGNCLKSASCGQCYSWECTRSREDFLSFQVIILPDGRFSFYYKSETTDIERILEHNTWLVGVSGTRYASDTCHNKAHPDAWCNADLGGTTLSCDDETIVKGGAFGSVTVYEAGNMCVNNVRDFRNLDVGTWQGE